MFSLAIFLIFVNAILLLFFLQTFIQEGDLARTEISRVFWSKYNHLDHRHMVNLYLHMYLEIVIHDFFFLSDMYR
jgi:hypothetical protein